MHSQQIKVVKAGTTGFFDVFQGDGFTTHTRIRRVKRADGYSYHHVSGVDLQPHKMAFVKAEIEKGNTEFTCYKPPKKEIVNGISTTTTN